MEVSVIIPVYNAAKFIRKAVESALQLNEVNEVILVEDASPDNALEICNMLTQQDCRVKLYQHPDKKNHGAGASRNLGIQKAACPFISFLDADDYYLPNRFEADKKVFDKELDADGVYNAIGVDAYTELGKELYFNFFSSNISTVFYDNLSQRDLFEGLIRYEKKSVGYIHLDGLTIRRKALFKLSSLFNPELRVHQDSELIIRMSYHLKLYSGSTKKCAAIRGVHDGNRIFKAYSTASLRATNISKQYYSLFKWAQMESIHSKYQKHLYRMHVSSDIYSYHFPLNFYFALRKIALDEKLFYLSQFYDRIHFALFGKNIISTFLLKAKYKLQLLMTDEPL